MKKYRLKRWVKNLLWVLVGAIAGIVLYQLLTISSEVETPVGDYNCNGGLIKICTGSKQVANYLGV